MTTTITAQVGDDGILKLALPMAAENANRMVRVTVETINETVSSGIPETREEWLRFLERTAGSIDDPTFIRHPQGELEERDPLQ